MCRLSRGDSRAHSMTERLQKLIATAGLASRRKAEALITAGRVRVNGRVVTELGTKADLHKDRVEVDGRRLVADPLTYMVLHKPREMVSTLEDPEGRPSLADILRHAPNRVHPVGRLDYHTSGVMLATNDGAFTEALLKPVGAVPKVYLAKMQGRVGIEALEAMRKGVVLDDGRRTRPAEVFVERSERTTTWVNITLKEGRNRQVHRMGDVIGHRVMRLVRLSFAGITADGLRPGDIRPMSSKELDQLKKKYLNPAKRRSHK